MKRFMSVFVCLFVAFVLVLSLSATAFAQRTVVSVQTKEGGASLRDKPDGKKITGIHAKTDLTVYSENGDWFYVSYRDVTGWVYKNQVIITKVKEIIDEPVDIVITDPTVPVLKNIVYGLNTKNDTVRWVQEKLKETSIWYQGDEWKVTGNLGKHTMAEIKRFMEYRGYFNHSGMIDQNVINELYMYLYGGNYSSVGSIYGTSEGED